MSLPSARTLVAGLVLGGLAMAGRASAQATPPSDTSGAGQPGADLAAAAGGAPAVVGTPPAAGETALEVAAGAQDATAASVAALRRELAEALEKFNAHTYEEAMAGADDRSVPLRIYGFADAGLQKLVSSNSASLAIIESDATTFVLGNLHLYLDAQPSPHWSAMIETRLTNLPDGAAQVGTPGSPFNRTSTNTLDPTNPSGGWTKVRWGGIVIERAYVQWRGNDLLSVRVGSFLTPFGIWNIDHGTPTLISLMLPRFEITQMFPIRQVGVELLGSHLRRSWEFGYHAYLSNGRTPGQVDPTEDKMVGGRVYARTSRPVRLTLGLSAFMGRYSDQERNVVQFDPYRVVATEVEAYDERGAGVDASVDVGALRLRSEFAFRSKAFSEGKRPHAFGRPDVLEADSNEIDWYALAAYQLPWAGLEPYVYLEVYKWPNLVGDGQISPSAGLNIHFDASAQLKLQYQHSYFYDDLQSLTRGAAAGYDVGMFAARLVLVF